MALRCLRNSMSGYRLVDQPVPAMCRNLAAAKLMEELTSGKAAIARYAAPSTQVEVVVMD
jgi:hypothetical protein